jgi:hypothetical protein
MRAGLRLLFGVLAIGCAGQERREVVDTAPYQAVIVFDWVQSQPGEAEAAPEVVGGAGVPPTPISPSTDGEDLPFPRGLIEDEILAGLDEQQVFSDFALSDLETMDQDARELRADLIVLVRIGEIAVPGRGRVSPGFAVLDGLLWFGTAIGGWWVPGRRYSTNSEIEIAWMRLDPAGVAAARTSNSSKPADVEAAFENWERLSSGDYALSLWDRAKFWKHPQSYLLNIIMPASFIPFDDPRELRRSLILASLEDWKAEIASNLRGRVIGAARAPFLFRLEDPPNCALLQGETSKEIAFRYRVEAGFKEHQERETVGFSRLKIELLRSDADPPVYETLKVLEEAEDIQRINQSIATDVPIRETIEGLGPGRNLVKFSAKHKLDGQWTQNTIVLRNP